MSAGVLFLSTYCSKNTLVLFLFIYFFKIIKKKGDRRPARCRPAGPGSGSSPALGQFVCFFIYFILFYFVFLFFVFFIFLVCWFLFLFFF